MSITINPSDQTITQYNIQTGGASNLLNNVAPSATSGVPVISQGAASQPIFGTAVVAGGGTGAVTLTGILTGNGTSAVTASTVTQHGVLIGGASNAATSTGVGATGTVLTGVTGSDPTFQAIPAATPSTQVVTIYEDFLGGAQVLTGNFSSNQTWANNSTSGGFSATNTTEAAHPGIYNNTSMITGVSLISLGGPGFILGSGTFTITWVFKIITLSASSPRYTLRLGIGDTVTGSDMVNGCYLEYSDNINTGQWAFKTASASTRTTTNSTTAVTTGWHNCTITVNAAASSVAFTMDGVSLGTAIATNIPTAQVYPVFVMSEVTGTVAANGISVDLCNVTYSLTSAR